MLVLRYAVLLLIFAVLKPVSGSTHSFLQQAQALCALLEGKLQDVTQVEECTAYIHQVNSLCRELDPRIIRGDVGMERYFFKLLKINHGLVQRKAVLLEGLLDFKTNNALRNAKDLSEKLLADFHETNYEQNLHDVKNLFETSQQRLAALQQHAASASDAEQDFLRECFECCSISVQLLHEYLEFRIRRDEEKEQKRMQDHIQATSSRFVRLTGFYDDLEGIASMDADLVADIKQVLLKEVDEFAGFVRAEHESFPQRQVMLGRLESIVNELRSAQAVDFKRKFYCEIEGDVKSLKEQILSAPTGEQNDAFCQLNHKIEAYVEYLRWQGKLDKYGRGFYDQWADDLTLKRFQFMLRHRLSEGEQKIGQELTALVASLKSYFECVQQRDHETFTDDQLQQLYAKFGRQASLTSSVKLQTYIKQIMAILKRLNPDITFEANIFLDQKDEKGRQASSITSNPSEAATGLPHSNVERTLPAPSSIRSTEMPPEQNNNKLRIVYIFLFVLALLIVFLIVGLLVLKKGVKKSPIFFKNSNEEA